MREANPRLTPREIAHVLVETSTLPSSIESVTNGAGLRHSSLVRIVIQIHLL
jgi:hypothetical protein